MPTILVVEDNSINMKLAVLLLESAGHRVLQAGDAESGMMIARVAQPDLVLMDIQLPGIDGLTATRRLKQDSATAHIKVAALTGLAMKDDEERAYAAGCDGYISKPIIHESFIETIERLLDCRQDS